MAQMCLWQKLAAQRTSLLLSSGAPCVVRSTGSGGPLLLQQALSSVSVSGDQLCGAHTSHHARGYCKDSGPVVKTTERMMPFEEYRKLRRSIKWRGRVAGAFTGVFGVALSAAVNAHLNPQMFEAPPEEVQPIFGMDPINFAVACGAASGVVGFIVGGALFGRLWRLLFRRTAAQLDERETDFLNRVQKRRFSEFQRFEDDYYADKVTTLSAYRQWIRQQQKRRNDSAEALRVRREGEGEGERMEGMEGGGEKRS